MALILKPKTQTTVVNIPTVGESSMINLLTMNPKAVIEDNGEQAEALLTRHLKFVVNEWECQQYSVVCSEMSLWKVSSALQKCIRRGWSELAIKYAQALFNGDKAAYLWARLPIIVLEDIGIANPLLCAQVLLVCRWAKTREHLGPKKIACWLVDQMSKSIKSRALCDLTCAAEFTKLFHAQQWLDAHGDHLINRLKDNAPLPDYAHDLDTELSPKVGSLLSPSHIALAIDEFGACARLLGNRQSESIHQKDSPIENAIKARSAFLEYASQELDVLGTYILLCSAKRSVDFLNAAWLPIMRMLKAEGAEGTAIELPMKEPTIVSGVPDVAFDQHVSQGKKALAYWRKSFEGLAACLQPIVASSHGDVVDMLNFQIESCLLDYRFATPALEQLTEWNDWYEAKYAGSGSPAEAAIIRSMMKSPEGQQKLLQARIKCSA